ncbi:MAG: hypothetical protein JWO09_3623 [Bacteroidetes bacterium]|nr:hypothetical protein [Bacteroidota bacterium]
MKYILTISSLFFFLQFLLTMFRFLFISNDGEMGSLIAFAIISIGLIYYSVLSVIIFKKLIREDRKNYLLYSVLVLIAPALFIIASL